MDEIKLAINHDKLAACGFSFDSWSDMYLYIESLVNWLESHNKNYTKEQYYKISNIKDILGCCQRRCDFVVFRRKEDVGKWRVKVCSL